MCNKIENGAVAILICSIFVSKTVLKYCEVNNDSYHTERKES